MKTHCAIAGAHRGISPDAQSTPDDRRSEPAERPKIEELLRKHKLDSANNATGLRLNSMACVALPTCGLALAEAERFLPTWSPQLEGEIEAAGSGDDAISCA